MRTLATLTLLFALGPRFAADSPAQVAAYEVKKIWDQAPHNAFTDLVRFQDRWICSFREGTGHAAGPGTIRILTSEDGKRWDSVASIEEKDVDLRDPKLSVTPDYRLMLVGGAAVPATRNPLTDHYSFVCFSKDGKAWTKPERVLESWQWLWRVTWHRGTAYGVAYCFDPMDNPKKYHAFLAKSVDGVKWAKVADFDLPNATEAALAFEGETMLCLQRRDSKPNSAHLGRSEPPYTKWTWQDLGVYVGGPQLVQRPNGEWWAAGRLTTSGKPQTVLCKLDIKQAKLEPMLTLPSGGDTSYPGMVIHEGTLWMSYYSSHEGKTGVYVARIALGR